MNPLEAYAAAGRATEEIPFAGAFWRIRSVSGYKLDDPAATLYLSQRLAEAADKAAGREKPAPMRVEPADEPAPSEAPALPTDAQMEQIAAYQCREIKIKASFVKAGLCGFSMDGKTWTDLTVRDTGSAPKSGILTVSELPPGLVELVGPRVADFSVDVQGYAARVASFLAG